MTKKIFRDLWFQNRIQIQEIDIEFLAAHYTNKNDKQGLTV
jgi:hypothetical protein